MKYIKIIKPDPSYDKDGPLGEFMVGHIFIARDFNNDDYQLYPTSTFNSFKANTEFDYIDYDSTPYFKSCCEDVTESYIDKILEDTKF